MAYGNRGNGALISSKQGRLRSYSSNHLMRDTRHRTRYLHGRYRMTNGSDLQHTKWRSTESGKSSSTMDSHLLHLILLTHSGCVLGSNGVLHKKALFLFAVPAQQQQPAAEQALGLAYFSLRLAQVRGISFTKA